jgi:pyridoxamine 5'-phosphate oxidase
MTERTGIFAGDDPFQLARDWLALATTTEVNDPDAVALATVDADGMPNVRMVLLRAIEAGAFVFYTNYTSAKAREIDSAGAAAFVLHWKTLRRQIRVRGHVTRETGPMADAYYASRSVGSRLGAWASRQSAPLDARVLLEQAVAARRAEFGDNPPRPPFWGGFRIAPIEIEFWADGADRLHDRFRWVKDPLTDRWQVSRLYP